MVKMKVNEAPMIRSSHRRCSLRKGVLKNFVNFKEKHLCWSVFFNKPAGLDSNTGVFL